MNSKQRITTTFVLLFSLFTSSMFAQEEGKIWTLRECVDYALENNLTVMNQELTVGINEVISVPKGKSAVIVVPDFTPVMSSSN